MTMGPLNTRTKIRILEKILAIHYSRHIELALVLLKHSADVWLEPGKQALALCLEDAAEVILHTETPISTTPKDKEEAK